MKKNIFFVMVAGLFALQSCKPKDADIQKEVDTAIVSVEGITAQVADGVVTLTGTVASDMDKNAAEASAKEVKGVKSVNNMISVVPPIISNDAVLQQGLQTALANFSTVQGAVQDSVITLTGTIKRADLPKVIEAVQVLRPKKVENQITVE